MAHHSTLHHLATERKKKPRTVQIKSRIELLSDVASGTLLGIRDVGAAFELCEKELFGDKHESVSALIVHFKKMPTIMTVGGFLPECDYYGRGLQTLGDANASYQAVSFNILAATGHAALAFLWFKGQKIAQGLAESFIAQKPEHYSTRAIQIAFEHLENTCMAPSWWLALRRVEQDTLLRRMQSGGSFLEGRKPNCLTYCGVTFDQWDYDHHELINV
jgi:hypothetical protein